MVGERRRRSTVRERSATFDEPRSGDSSWYMVVARPAARPPTPEDVTPGLPHARTGASWHLAALLYLLLGFALWYHAWVHGPGSTLPAGSIDPEQSVWFLGWAAHGAHPFFTSAMYSPQGVNLLDNTSTLALGVALAPLTALFGPVVTFNVAVVLAPATSALAASFAARRYIPWAPAAFVAGLVYGFGPFLATDLQVGHLNLTFAPVPPLVVLLLDELLVTQRRDPRWVGAVLGLLVVVQFFVSTEVLAIMAVVGCLALVTLALAHRAQVRRRLRHAAPGIAIGAGIVLVALAYPAWFALLGPEHVSGPVFGSTAEATSTLWATIAPHGERPGVRFISRGNGAYLGVPLVVVLALGAVLLRRARTFLYFAAMAAVCFVMSLGPSLHVTDANTHVPLPAAVLAHIPVLWSIMPSRFGLFVDLFAALAVGMVVDRLRGVALASSKRARPMGRPGTSPALLAGAVARVVIASLAAALPWPYAVRAIRLPASVHTPEFEALPPGSVISTYPTNPLRQGPMLVAQALGGYRFALLGGYAIVPGPDGHTSEQPRADPLERLYAAGALGTLGPGLSSREVDDVRRALVRLHVAAVLVDGSATGGPAVATALDEVLGPPTLRAPGVAGWITARTR